LDFHQAYQIEFRHRISRVVSESVNAGAKIDRVTP
jgi:hypothetical protein